MDIQEIKHLAELSKLEFSDDELKEFVKDFDSLVGLADKVRNADISGVANYNTVDMTNLRQDKHQKSVETEELLKNAPEKQKGMFVVPRIVE